MIEAAMYFALGFLVAFLIALIMIPLVHHRAVRLTTRRVQAAAPISLAEIQADKDQMRAEFAMATRRLELSLADLKEKHSQELVELGRKAEAIAKLKAELAEKSRMADALQEEHKRLEEQLRGSQEELALKTRACEEAERKLKEREEQFSRLGLNLEETSVAADSHRIEIVALRTQIATLRDQVADRDREIKEMQARGARDREERTKLEQELAALKHQTEGAAQAERAENDVLRDRLNEVSAEVARLMAALEGADSPIQAILEQGPESDDAPPADTAKGARGNQNGTLPIAFPRLSLADRIRALQGRASRRSSAG